jgi:nickel transport protein
MKPALRLGAVLSALGFLAASAGAHYTMLLPQLPSGAKGKAVAVVYQWGHPFEHQLFDAPAPAAVFALDPDGKKIDLAKALEKITVPGEDKKKVAAHRFTLTPERRGDYVLVLNAPPMWMEEEKEFWQDTARVVLHVEAQKGWDRPIGQALDMVPFTRPYGLLPGSIFQAQVLADGKAMGGTVVEIERYNPMAPKELPADEFITRRCKTDPNGVVSCTLPEPGWWCLTAERPAGQREEKGKSYPLRQRITLWVYVNAAAGK